MANSFRWRKNGAGWNYVENATLPYNIAGIVASDVVDVDAIGLDTTIQAVLGPLTASFSTSAAAGSVITAITGLGASETLTGVTPNDGRLAVSSSNLVVGLSASSAGSIAAVVTTSLGRTLNIAVTVAATYLGFVSTAGRLPNTLNTGFTYFNSKRRHIARDRIQNPKLVLPYFYVGATELGAGGSASYTASIEYNGTIVPVTFGGASSGVAPNKSYVVSDVVPGIDIPNGASFFVHVFGNTPLGMMYNAIARTEKDEASGERFEFSASVLPDRTLSSTFTSSAGKFSFSTFVIAQTTKPSALLIGDSIGAALYDDLVDTSTDLGITARAVGPFMAYANLCISSDTRTQFLASNTNRLAFGQWASHVVDEYLANDFGSRNLAQMQSDALAIRNLYLAQDPKKKFVGTTGLPRAAAGTFPAGTGQTQTANEQNRIDWNNWMRGIPTGYVGYLELADILETDQNASSVTVRNGHFCKQNMFQDGLHPSTTTLGTGYSAVTPFSSSFQPIFSYP